MEKFTSLFGQIINAVLQWVNNLIGKNGSADNIEQQQQSEEVDVDPRGRQMISDGEDPVAKDVHKLESVLEEKVDKAKQSPVTKGMVARTKQIVVGVFNDLKNMVTSSQSGGSGMLGKIIALLLVTVLLIVLFNLGKGLSSRLNRDNGQEQEVVRSVTPTQFIVQTSEPSIYADDEEILELERDIGLLENSMNESAIRETRLNPPNLDFDISF